MADPTVVTKQPRQRSSSSLSCCCAAPPAAAAATAEQKLPSLARQPSHPHVNSAGSLSATDSTSSGSSGSSRQPQPGDLLREGIPPSVGGAEAQTDAKGALYSKPDDTVGQLVDRQPNVAKEGADPKRSHVLADAERLEQKHREEIAQVKLAAQQAESELHGQIRDLEKASERKVERLRGQLAAEKQAFRERLWLQLERANSDAQQVEQKHSKHIEQIQLSVQQEKTQLQGRVRKLEENDKRIKQEAIQAHVKAEKSALNEEFICLELARAKADIVGLRQKRQEDDEKIKLVAQQAQDRIQELDKAIEQQADEVKARVRAEKIALEKTRAELDLAKEKADRLQRQHEDGLQQMQRAKEDAMRDAAHAVQAADAQSQLQLEQHQRSLQQKRQELEELAMEREEAKKEADVKAQQECELLKSHLESRNHELKLRTAQLRDKEQELEASSRRLGAQQREAEADKDELQRALTGNISENDVLRVQLQQLELELQQHVQQLTEQQRHAVATKEELDRTVAGKMAENQAVRSELQEMKAKVDAQATAHARSMKAQEANSDHLMRELVRERGSVFFLSRYQIDWGPPIHRSATCTVVFARELETGTLIALKLMRHRHQFEAEIFGRHANGHPVPAGVVIDVQCWHTPKDSGLTDSVTNRQEEQENTPCAYFPQHDEYPFVLVMPRADRSLHDACAKQRIAGFRSLEIREIVRDIALALQALHAIGVCHGDLKQRNVIRLNGKWILCDMDAAKRFGCPVGDKTSSAYCPPELARVKFVNSPSTMPSASASFDVWSFGVLLFELCSGQTLFSQDIANDELIDDVDKMRLCTWLVISDDDMAPILSSPELQGDFDSWHKRQQTIADARNLIRWCLQGAESLRPSCDEILAHRFLSRVPSSEPQPQRMRYHAFLSHAQADASGTVSTLFHLYKQLGLHTWLDMRQELLTLPGMRQGVCDSDVFVLILSETVLTSWFCQQELLCAIEHKKKIQLIIEKEPRFSPFDMEAWEQSRGGERAVAISNHAKPQVITVTKDAQCPWQQQQNNEALTKLLCDTIDDHLATAITYRRRDFEQEAMMFELARRNGVAVPDLTRGSSSDALTSTSSATNRVKVFVIHNSDSAHLMLSDLERAITDQEVNVTLMFDKGDIASADKVLLMLSRGVLTGYSLSLLETVLAMDAQERRDRIVAIYSEAAGWSFNNEEHRGASTEIRHCLDAHEAIAFRPRDPEGPDSHEFSAMLRQILKLLVTDRQYLPYVPQQQETQQQQPAAAAAGPEQQAVAASSSSSSSSSSPSSAAEDERAKAAGAVLCVEGAGTTACNGYYEEDGTNEGKPRYQSRDEEIVPGTISWCSSRNQWSMDYINPLVDYINRKDSATPPSDGWEVGDGTAPAPRLRWLATEHQETQQQQQQQQQQAQHQAQQQAAAAAAAEDIEQKATALAEEKAQQQNEALDAGDSAPQAMEATAVATAASLEQMPMMHANAGLSSDDASLQAALAASQQQQQSSYGQLPELPTLDGPDPFAQPSASGERPKWGQRYSASSATGSPRSPGARAGSPSSNNGSPRAGVKDMKKYISDTGSDSDEDPQDPVAAMQAKYPKLKECAALVKLGLTAADTIEIKEDSRGGYSRGRYEGQVNQDGERHGKGVFELVFSWSDGHRYVGEWRNNNHHGHGTHTSADGNVLSGKWENHKFLG